MDASTSTSDTGSDSGPPSDGPMPSSMTPMEMRMEHGEAVNSAGNDSGFWHSTVPTVPPQPPLPMDERQAWIPTFYPFSFPGVPQLYPPLPLPPLILTAVPIKQESEEEEPLYVNAKQYERILKRREARAKLAVSGRIPTTERPKYLHESRHQHALNRVRQSNGKFKMGATRGRGRTCPPTSSKSAARPGASSASTHSQSGLGNSKKIGLLK